MALALLAFWLVLSGHYEPRMLALGVGSVLLVLYLSTRMGVVDEEGVPVHLVARVPVYALWLTKEIFLASVRVARIILDPRLPIRPGLARYHAAPAHRGRARLLRQFDHTHARHLDGPHGG